MGLKGYLSYIGLGTFLAWFAWAIIILNVSPKESGIGALVMFYVTLAVALVGTLTLVMTILRVYIMQRKVIVREIRTGFRHSVLFALIAIVSLVLSAMERFTVWSIVILVAIISVVEYFFIQFHRGRG